MDFVIGLITIQKKDDDFFSRAFFSYTESKIGVKAKGKEFADFKAHFTADDRGFGYIKIMVNIVIIILTITIISIEKKKSSM